MEDRNAEKPAEARNSVRERVSAERYALNANREGLENRV